MDELNIDSTFVAVRNYLDNTYVRMPFFVAFNARRDLVQLKNHLSSCKVVRLSDFCGASDAFPDEDRVIEHIQHSKEKSLLLLGVGEYAALSDDTGIVSRLTNIVPDKAKVVVPLWNGHGTLEEFCGEDPRIRGRRCVALTRQSNHWSVKIFKPGLITHPDVKGFKALLQRLEAGHDDELNVISSMQLNPKWCRKINSAYEIYKIKHPDSSISPTFFTEEQWKYFCDDDRVKERDIESADGCLEILDGVQSNRYLQLVVAQTERYSDWKHNLLTAIFSISFRDDTFRNLYEERKNVVSNFDKDSVEEYVTETRRFSDPETQIHYLTTSTKAETNEMMTALSKCDALPEDIVWIFPDLWEYMRDFKFSYGEFSDILTSYFTDYKRQKVKNQIEPFFNGVVKELAENRPQFVLPTRESVLEKLDDTNTCLFWADALGCEWLGYIQSAAERKGMKLKVTPTRAILPSITSINRGFYDEWKGPKAPIIKQLDKIKHGEFENTCADRKLIPAHLFDELTVLDSLIGDVRNWLKHHNGSKVILTSDHGATRLSVISDSYTVWEMPEKGKHGGRCCKVSEFDGILPSCSTMSDDGYWHVLAGHDQFRGGRCGDVEVHGGATLEEMIVPVVELEMLDSSVRVELIKKAYKVTFRDTEISLEFFSTSRLSNPSIRFQGKEYAMFPCGDDGHYLAKIPKIATGDYTTEVYDGDTKISNLAFSVISGGATINNMNDFF